MRSRQERRLSTKCLARMMDVEEVQKYSDIISTLEKEFRIKFRQ